VSRHELNSCLVFCNGRSSDANIQILAVSKAPKHINALNLNGWLDVNTYAVSVSAERIPGICPVGQNAQMPNLSDCTRLGIRVPGLRLTTPRRSHFPLPEGRVVVRSASRRIAPVHVRRLLRPTADSCESRGFLRPLFYSSLTLVSIMCATVRSATMHST
jgi:hypothetical protein